MHGAVTSHDGYVLFREDRSTRAQNWASRRGAFTFRPEKIKRFASSGISGHSKSGRTQTKLNGRGGMSFVVWQEQWQSTECDTRYVVQRKKFDVILRFLVDRISANEATQTRCIAVRCSNATSKTGNRFGWSFFFAVWRRCARSQLHMNSLILVESQGSCALVRIVRLQKFDRRDNMIFTVHLNGLIDENTPLGHSTIETCLQEANKYQNVTKISCDIGRGSRFEASWLDCVTMMSEMTIAVIVVSASCHHLTRADSGWSRISWFSRVALPWLRGGTSVAPWRHKCSHVPVFRRLFDRLPVRLSTSDLHHRILQKKLYHIRAYDFGVQFSFKVSPVFIWIS